MKLEKIRLKNWTGILRGTGREEIEVDFTGKTGLIALSGQNGSGKSSLLELTAPYTRLASREGAFTHHVYGRQAERELSFFYNGDHYRTLIKVDSQSEKQEGFLWKNGKSEINGKITSYNKYIKELLGTPELFYASVFCSQNSKKLSDMRTGELKELFAEFLRLDRIQGFETTSKQIGNILSGQAGQFETRMAGLTEIVGKKESVIEQHLSIGVKMGDLADSRTALEQVLAIKKKDAEALRETIAKSEALQAQRADLQRSIDRMTKDMEDEKRAVGAELNGLAAKAAELVSRMNGITSRPIDIRLEPQSEQERKRDTRISEILTLLDEADKLLEDREAIILAADEVRQTERQIEELAPIADRLQADVDEKLESEKEFKDKLAGYENIEIKIRNGVIKPEADAELRTLRQKADFLTAKMADLGKKDPSCQSTTCVFIKGAIEASEQLPAIKEDIRRRETEIAEINERADLERKENARMIDDYRGVLKLVREKLAAGRETLQAKQVVLRGLRQMLPTLKATAAKVSGIAVAEQRKADLEAELISLREQQAADREARTLRHEERVKREEEDRARRVEDLRASLEEVQEQKKQKELNWSMREDQIMIDLGDLVIRRDQIVIDTEAPGKLKALDGEIQLIEKVTIPDLEKKIQDYRDQISNLKGQLDRLAEAETELQGIREQRDAILKDVSDWRYIQQACGKNGLQALEIDGAAPLITGYANQLLSQAFGPLYSVRFRTQDEEGKECLDIYVISEDGTEILLENLSGGQKIWCLMALRLAMTLLSKEKGGHVVQTAFADEMDGPLDPENALNFVQMYRSFMQVGGFKDFLFISHRPECRAMADNVLTFEHGKNPYWS